MTTTDTTARIVVGVDGSQGSKTALTWAMTQARLSGATVEAVTTWQDPAMYGIGYGWAPVAYEGDSIATIMTKVLDEAVTEVSGQLDRRSPSCRG
jgi:nucleotide-binding universal stress UspA family protein